MLPLNRDDGIGHIPGKHVTPVDCFLLRGAPESPQLVSTPARPVRSLQGLHLAALGDDHILVGLVLAAVARLGGFHHLDDIHAVDDLAEDDVLVVEERRRDGGDEELGAVGVGAGVLDFGVSETWSREAVATNPPGQNRRGANQEKLGREEKHEKITPWEAGWENLPPWKADRVGRASG